MHGFLEEILRVHTPQHLAWPQVALAIRVQCEAGLVEGRAMADGGQRVLQDAPRPAVHVHITAGDERQLEAPPFFPQAYELLVLPPVGQ